MPLIHAGMLDRKIEIFAPRTTPGAASGGPVTRFKIVATVWGRRTDGAGETTESGKVRQRVGRATFLIRFYQGLTADHILGCEEDTWEIIGKPRELERRKWMELDAKTRNPPPTDP